MERSAIKITSEIKNIKKASAQILDSLSRYSINEDVLFDIRLCAEEAIRNAMVHGNGNNKKLHVKINYWVENDLLNIEVEDEGPGFDPAKVPDPTAKSNMTKESGRGIRLIKKLMDSVDFNKKGNTIKMRRKLWQ